MPDIFTKEKRSAVMRAVKPSRNKSTELRLIEYFKAQKITGWRRNYPIFGYPDFVFPKKRIVIYTDGCFWHGHDCRNTKPKENADYWNKKRERNCQRDKDVTERLTAKGWVVLRIWECELKNNTFEAKLTALSGSATPQ